MTEPVVGPSHASPGAAGPGPGATAEEATLAALRHAIIRGRLQPGTRLRQERLAAELGVSRIPLRDAFRRLEAEGLIEIDGRRGARVTSLDGPGVTELYELRRMLELRCLRLAVRNLTPEGAAALPVPGEPDGGQHVSVDPDTTDVGGFYRELYSWSGRRRMTALVLQLRRETDRYHAVIGASEHPEIDRRLRELVIAGDADAAARLLRDHLRSARERLVAVLRREGRPPRPRKRKGRSRGR